MLSFSDPLPHRPRRVLVAGVSGSGKTTLAGTIASRIDAPHTEIDSLYHGPNWTPRPEFAGDVDRFSRRPVWVSEWQYRAVRPMLAERADLLVWLDLPFWRSTFPRLARRTVTRRLGRVEIWNGNIEPPLWTLVTDRDHILRWGIRTRHKYRGAFEGVERTFPHLVVVRLCTTAQVTSWLSGPLAEAMGTPRPDGP